MPTYWPTLYVTTQIRNNGHSVATMDVALGAIQVLFAFAEARNLDLKDRFRSRQFLRTHEVEDLCGFAQLRRRGKRGGGKGRKPGTVSADHYYRRLTIVASYLEWFARMLLEEEKTIEDDKAIREMAAKIRSRRPASDEGSSVKDRAPSEEAFVRLMEVIDPEHPDNPFEDDGSAVRNRLIVMMSAELGIRRGELLGVQVPDIDWSSRTLTIHRRPDDAHDPRLDPPRAKTLARELAMSGELTECFYDYVMGERSRTRSAGTHLYLLVVHKKGTNEGMPLSKSGLKKVFKRLRECDPLLVEVHPHALRHWWNFSFSREMDNKPKKERLSPEEQEKIREHVMGWKEGSGTARRYNRRFIERKAQQVSLDLAEKANKIRQNR